MDKVAATQAQDFNFNGMTPQVTNVNGGPIQSSLNFGTAFAPGDFNQAATTAANSAYASAAARLDPQFAQSDSDMKSKLANSGIAENSDAYRRELDNAARAKTDAYGQAQNNAYQQGLAAQEQGYAQDLSTRQQNSSETAQAGAFANTAQNQTFNQGSSNAALANSGRQQEEQEASYLRNLPLNDIAALLGTGTGVQNPTFSNVAQVGVAAPDYQGAVYANYNAANQQYQAAQQAQSSGLGSIFGLAGTLGAAAIKTSDMRFKRNIKRIGTLANGLATYTYNYLWSVAQEFGVMAQDALVALPEAVVTDGRGMMYVDYRKVWNGR